MSKDTKEIKFLEHPYQKVSAKKGDVIVLSYPEIYPAEHVEYFFDCAKKTFSNNKVLLLDENIKLGVLESVPNPVNHLRDCMIEGHVWQVEISMGGRCTSIDFTCSRCKGHKYKFLHDRKHYRIQQLLKKALRST